MNSLLPLLLLLLFSFVGAYAGRQLQGIFANDLSRIRSQGGRTLAAACVYAAGNTVVVWVLASFVGIPFPVLFWFILCVVFEMFLTPGRR